MEPFQTKNLYDAKRYDELAELWNNEEERNQFDEWDFLNVIRAFYDQKKYETCLEIYKAFHRKYPDSDRLNDKMAWSLYHTKIKPFDFKTGDRNQLIRQAEYVLEHSSQSLYSPKWRVVRFMLEHIRNGDFGQSLNDQDALRYLDLVDPNALSGKCEQILAEDGRTVELASDKEIWYVERSKLLLSTGAYEQCVRFCDQAIARIPAFHYNNDGWIKYRKAKALFAIDHSEEAISTVKDIQARGLNHWCLFQLLYEIDVKAGRHNDATMHAAMCALADPSHEIRVSFYTEYADYLESKGYLREAALHRHLVLLIREEKEWVLREKHQSWTLPDEIAALSKRETIQQLQKFWRESMEKNVIWQTGSISRLLAEGKAGFIESEEGKNYYFNARDISDLRGEPEIGMKVRFTLMDKLDKSKGIVKPNAVRISIIGAGG